MGQEVDFSSTDGLSRLDAALAELREAETLEKRTEQARRDELLASWARLAPCIAQAIELVNEVLAKHGFDRGVTMGTPDFGAREPESYGAKGTLGDVKFEFGGMLIVLSNGTLYVNADLGGHWSEGYTVSVDHATVESIADAIATTVKWLILEEPG